jgi:hypothetical protein
MPDLGDDDLKALHARLEELGPMPSARCSRATASRRRTGSRSRVGSPTRRP